MLMHYYKMYRSKKMKCGRPVNFASAVAFKFTAENPRSFFIKHAVYEKYKEVQFLRVGRPLSISLDKLKPKYNAPLRINKKKLAYVKSLLPFIPPIYSNYFHSLVPNDDDEENNIEFI